MIKSMWEGTPPLLEIHACVWHNNSPMVLNTDADRQQLRHMSYGAFPTKIFRHAVAWVSLNSFLSDKSRVRLSAAFILHSGKIAVQYFHKWIVMPPHDDAVRVVRSADGFFTGRCDALSSKYTSRCWWRMKNMDGIWEQTKSREFHPTSWSKEIWINKNDTYMITH